MKKVVLFVLTTIFALSMCFALTGCMDEIASYKVSFDSDGGSVVAEQVVDRGSLATEPDAPVKAGYTFSGWALDGVAYGFTEEVTADITLKATWTANTDTAYKVEHYRQNLADDEYTLATEDTENKTGTTDTLTAAEAKEYTGFTAKTIEQDNIAGDGSTVVKVYYDRNTYTVTVDENGGEEVGDITGVKYGATVTAPAVTRAGYTLAGWTVNDETYDFAASVIADITLKAVWTANTDTAYTVEHYQQNLDDDEYTLVTEDTENKTGTTDTLTAAEAKEYTGFTAKTIEQANIAGDGSTVIKVYYDRNTFTVTFDENGGEEVEDITGVKYGATVTAPAITKDGATLLGWNYDFNKVITSDITVKALWGVITLNEEEKTFTKAGTLELGATETHRDDDGSEDLVWESSNNDVATVDENGLVTAVGIGETVITAKFADGKGGATCNVVCRDPYANVNQGTHTYDFATGEVFITGPNGGENNDVAYFNLNGKGKDDKLDDNFAVEFYAKSTLGDQNNYTIKVMSSKCGRGTAMNYNWFNTRADYWVAGNWGGVRNDPGIVNIATTDYVKVRLERSVDREAETIAYKITIWTVDGSNSKVIEFSDKINDNSNPDYTYAVGFGVRHTGGDGKGIYVKDFTYTATAKLSKTALEFIKAGEETLTYSGYTGTDELTWASLDEKVATVENGKVSAKATGATSIVLKDASGASVAVCNVVCRDPYANANQGTHTYDFATGEVFITGSNGGENNDVAYFNLNNKGNGDKLDDNFAVEFYAKSTLGDQNNYTIKVMSSKCGRGTAMNYNWFNTRADYWVAGNWGGVRNDPGIVNIATTDYVKVRLERSVDREAETIAYKITIWTADGSNSKVIEFSDKINDNSNPDYTYAVGFGVRHTANDGKGIYVKDFTYTAL